MSVPKTFPAFAWPGGYPILYLDEENETLCPACATIYRDLGGKVTSFIHYEGAPQHCADCNGVVTSAYGDPEKEAENASI